MKTITLKLKLGLGLIESFKAALSIAGFFLLDNDNHFKISFNCYFILQNFPCHSSCALYFLFSFGKFCNESL